MIPDSLALVEKIGIHLSNVFHFVLAILRGLFRKEREKFLTELAQKAAQRVRRTKNPIFLEPMSAYERRFIHLELAEYPDIATESIGEEPERKIVVRLYP